MAILVHYATCKRTIIKHDRARSSASSIDHDFLLLPLLLPPEGAGAAAGLEERSILTEQAPE